MFEPGITLVEDERRPRQLGLVTSVSDSFVVVKTVLEDWSVVERVLSSSEAQSQLKKVLL